MLANWYRLLVILFLLLICMRLGEIRYEVERGYDIANSDAQIIQWRLQDIETAVEYIGY
jgi:hypothetical protein